MDTDMTDDSVNERSVHIVWTPYNYAKVNIYKYGNIFSKKIFN